MPYTYILQHKKTGKKYYGVRFAKNCKPSDLWSTYFSSSKVVKDIVKNEGKESFTHKIDKVFESSEDAALYEQEFLSSIKNKEEWLNQCYNLNVGHTSYKTEEHKQKISISNSKPKTGKSLTASLNNLKKAVERNTGSKQSIETQNKKRDSYRKYWNSLEDKTRPHLRKKVNCDGKIFESVSDVVNYYKISWPTVKNRVMSEKWNWFYV